MTNDRRSAPATATRGLALAAALAALPCAAAQDDVAWLNRAIDGHWSRAQARTAAKADAWSVALAPAGAGAQDAAHGFEEAQQRVRALLADIRGGKKPAKPIVVHVASGVYTLAKPLHFTADDGGDEKSPVSYVADEPGRAVVSGGVQMQPAGGGGDRVRYDLPGDLKVDWSVRHQLFVDGRRAVLARQPNAGTYWYVQPGSSDKAVVKPDAQALQWLRGLSADDRARAELELYHSWTTSLHHFDVADDALKLAVPAKWGPLSLGKSQRFFVENVPAALDAPGEWIGAGRQVTYIPEGGNAKAAAVMPVLPRLVEVAGTAAAPVRYLSFEGLHFMYTESSPDEANFIDGQAAAAVGAAIEVDHARHVDIRNCQLSHLGGYGIWMRVNVADSTIDDTVIHDTGAGGIKVGTGGQPASADVTTHNIGVTKNVVAYTGKLFPGAVGVWVGWANDNRIQNNLVARTTYAGISVGWKWGFGGPASQRNHIDRNVLFDIGQATLSDFGAIYTLGESPGTQITENLIREVRSYPNYGGWKGLGAFGIYLDEGSSGIRVLNNVVVGTDSGGFHINYGHDDLVEGNVFAGGEQAEVTLFHDKGGKSLDFRGNTLFPLSAAPFQGELNANDSSYQNNLVGAGSDGQLNTGACGQGCTRRALRLEVGRGLKDLRASDAQTADDTIKRVLASAGPEGGVDALRDVSITERRPQVPKESAAAAAGGLDLAVAMASLAPGARPDAFQYRPATEPVGISIVEDRGSPDGGRCLRFTDGPNFQRSFEPFAFASPDASTGPWIETFVLKVDERAEFIHEWRDNVQPYHSGPKLLLHRGVAEVAGRRVADVRPGQWYRYTVRAAPNGAWSLDVENLADGTRQSARDLPPGTPGWNSLRWVGFVSNATTTTQACLADVKLRSDVAH